MESAAGAQALSCAPHAVKTVGVFQYRMGIGGAERVVAHQVRTWLDLGYSVVFFAEEPRAAGAQSLPEAITWVELGDAGSMKPAGYAERARIIAEAVRNHHVDVLVHNQWWNPLLAWDALLFKALGVPVCLVCHSVYTLMFHEANALEFDCPRILRHLDGLVTLSRFDQSFWQHFNPRVMLANNPTTTRPGSAPRSKLDSKNVIWVGRLSDFDKQPNEAIEIFARVAQAEPDATLTLVGPAASARELAKLEKLARQLRVEGRITFAGPSNDPSPLYEQASVYLLTSSLEGWCLTLAESKAHGLPCVMYDLSYLTLAEGNRGIVSVAQGDRDAAAAAIVALLRDRALRERLGQEAFDHIVEVSSFDFAAFWHDAFVQLAEGSPTRAGFELDDAHWNLLADSFKASLAKALDQHVPSYVKRKALKKIQTV